jgi:hypothetical protein
MSGTSSIRSARVGIALQPEDCYGPWAYLEQTQPHLCWT